MSFKRLAHGPFSRLRAPLALALVLTGCAAPRSPSAPLAPLVALTILATTDFHGALEQVDSERDTKRPLGGAAALAATIRRERESDADAVILLDAGDIYQGTALSNLTRGRAAIEFMNAVGYDAAALGNHEFDWGVPTLLERMQEARFPLLVANVRERDTGRAPEWARPYVILERGGLRVAVLGLITPDTPSVTLPANVAAYEFLEPAGVANEFIPALVPAQADLVVVLCHIGGRMESDGRLSGDVVELSRAIQGEAAVVGGHTHQVVHGEVEGVPIVEAGSSGRQLGRIELTYERATRTVTHGSASVLTVYADALAPDPEVAGLVARSRAAVAPVLDEVIGEAEFALEAVRSECGMGNLLADVMRGASQARFAFQNPGGVRAPLDAGPIVYSEIYRVMPFDNRIVTLELSGAELRELLEQAAAKESFLHASGLRYALDLSRPVGARVTQLEGDDGSPLADDERYPVAINDFMAQGGDSLPVITARPGTRDSGILVRDALGDYIRAETRAGRRIASRVEGRVTVVGRR